jgi:toxin CptA
MPRRKLNAIVGVFALVVVVCFIFASSLATVLSTWLGAIVAWIASWAGIMLVHYFVVEKGALNAQRLFDPIGSRRLPDVNWATMVCFAIGIGATWTFMYGSMGVMQGFGSRALGGLDLSWLAGSMVAAALYALLGPRAYRRHYEATQRATTVEGTSIASERGLSR